MKDKNQEVLESLKETLDTAKWSWLEPHQARGAVILVAPELDLMDVAFRVATDDKASVEAWLQSQKLARPTADQVATWTEIPDKPFSIVVVQPYVLIQEKLLH